jgi:hypothetical protein
MKWKGPKNCKRAGGILSKRKKVESRKHMDKGGERIRESNDMYLSFMHKNKIRQRLELRVTFTP